MNARNNVKKLHQRNFNVRRELAAVRLRLAARLDFLVARWLERCAVNAVAAQELFRNDRRPSRGFGIGVSLVASSPRWEE
jgi:hypothetical protein